MLYTFAGRSFLSKSTFKNFLLKSINSLNTYDLSQLKEKGEEEEDRKATKVFQFAFVCQQLHTSALEIPGEEGRSEAYM